MKKVAEVFVRNPYNYDVDLASHEARSVNVEESLTQQDQAADADINVIVKRFGLTGELPEGNHLLQFGDFTGVTDFQSALNVVRRAGEIFMELPADLRAKFDNDAQKYLTFCENPDNLPELRKLGLAKPEVVDHGIRESVEDVAGAGRAPGKGAGGDAAANKRGGVGAEGDHEAGGAAVDGRLKSGRGKDPIVT